jgi:ribosomal-protein-alanine N-acetyltransferase
MNEKLRIEKMKASDIDAVYALELDVYAEDPSPVEWFIEGVKSETAFYFVAYYGEELVGYCGIYLNTSVSPNYCKIGTIVVNQRFRTRGIGTALMEKMFAIAQENKINRIKLEVSTKNNAVALYSKLGFQIEETIENFYDEINEDAYVMWRYS